MHISSIHFKCTAVSLSTEIRHPAAGPSNLPRGPSYRLQSTRCFQTAVVNGFHISVQFTVPPKFLEQMH